MGTIFMVVGGIYVGYIVLKAIREAVETEAAAFEQKRWVKEEIKRRKESGETFAKGRKN